MIIECDILAGQTPTLFLNEEERTQLTDLVILDPAWLIKVMKVIFEMDESYKGVPLELIIKLINKGVASSTLLRQCWIQFTDSTSSLSFRQLCLMLQANCLIYPVRNLPGVERTESDPVPSSNPPPSPPTRSLTSQDADKEEEFYLVPCRLPDKCKTPVSDKLPWITFYFDFHKFLPKEIYHRFICLLLAASQSKGSRLRRNVYTSTYCVFYNIDGCHWKIELEANLHRLKVSIV